MYLDIWTVDGLSDITFDNQYCQAPFAILLPVNTA